MRLFATLVLAVLCGCGGEPLPDPNMMMTMNPPPMMTDTSSHEIDVGSLPCGVAVVVARNCASCHGSPPTQNAPMTLLSRADFMKPFAGDASITLAQRSLLRMRATVGVMPPSGPASDADIATFAAWVEAGALPGSCTQAPPPAPTTCDTARHWTSGNRSAELMNPGEACVACHVRERVNEIFTASGTVYTDLHADPLCIGSAKGTVEIIGADGAVVSLPVNASGNFATFAPFKKPYTARVKMGTKVRTMSSPQMNGDCNICHTVQGTEGAPGRIIWPGP
jgi:hypothetical protein